MSDGGSGGKRFGGVRGVLLLVLALAGGVGYRVWHSDAAGSALATVAGELGLTREGQGRRQQLRGRIDGFGVRVDFTPENRAGETRYFTDFSLHAPGAPPGRIVGADLRERAIAGALGTERIETGDRAFDEAVFVIGEPGPMLAHLDAEARAAVRAAAAAGWTLEGGAWSARKSGLLMSARKIQSLLELGLAAARAARFEGDHEAALRERAANDPVAATRAAAAAALAGSGGGG